MDTENPTQKTIDTYIAAFPQPIQAILQKVRATIQQAAPAAQEAMKYGIPTFTLQGNLVHFAAYKNHIGFYPAPSGITAFSQELAAYKQSKGAIQFPLNQPIPYDLITQIVLVRVQQNLEKAAAKKK